MTRKKIAFGVGSIAPIQRRRWDSASEKLQEATAGLVRMDQAGDRVEFEQGWTQSVDSIEEFWSRFYHEGDALFSKFQPWAGGIIRLRKSDELLTYLYQARHQSQHGRISLQWDDGTLHIAPGFAGHIKSLAIFSDGTYVMDATPLQGSQTEAIIKFEGGHARLPTVVNSKHTQTFPPPRIHLGKPIDGIMPLDAIRLGIDFYQSVLNSAFEKFETDRNLS
jgi:hypothetical protein